MVTTIFDEGPERDRALGLFGAMAGVGFATGALAGGLITGLLSWRWVFFVNVPIGLDALLLNIPQLPASCGVTWPRHLDVLGALLGTGAVAALVLSLAQASLPNGGLWSVLIAGRLAVALCQRSSRSSVAREPLVPFDIFRARDLSLANGVALLGIATASLVALVLTIYVQEVMRYSPLLTGLVFLPAGASGILGGLLAARAVGRQGLRAAAVAGPLILAAGCLLLTGIAADGSLGTVVVGYIVAGVGIVAAAVTSTIAGTAGVEPHSQGLASGVLNTSQQVGGGIGASLASVILGAAAFSYAESAAVSLTGGGQVGLLVGLGLSLVAAALALCIDGGRSILEPVAGR